MHGSVEIEQLAVRVRELEVARRTEAATRTRRWRLVTLGLLAAIPNLSHALELETGDIADGEQISAALMVTRFEAIATAVTALEDAAPVLRVCHVASDESEACAWVDDVESIDDGVFHVVFDGSIFPTMPACFCASEQSTVWCNTAQQEQNALRVEQFTGGGTLYPGDGFRLMCVAEQ